MKFKKGDKVTIVKNLGEMNSGYSNEYYYGNATIEEVPLNSKGKILRADLNSFFVELENGYRLLFHPKEIEYANPDKKNNSFNKSFDRLKGLFPNLSEIEKHPVFESAKNMPVFCIEGKVYAINESDDLIEENYFDVHAKQSLSGPLVTSYFEEIQKTLVREINVKTPIVIVSELKDLDELAMQRSQKDIEKIKNEFTNQIKKDLVNKGEKGENLDLPQMIAKYVFPYLKNEKYDNIIDALIEGKKLQNANKNSTKTEQMKKQKIKNLEIMTEDIFSKTENYRKEIENERFEELNDENDEPAEKIGYLPDDVDWEKYKITRGQTIEELLEMDDRNNKIEELLLEAEETKEANEEEKTKQNNIHNLSSLILKASKGKNFAILQGKTYELSTNPAENINAKIVLGKKTFYVKETKEIEYLEEKYLFELSKKIRTDALKENFTKEKIKEIIEDANDELVYFKGKQEHEEENFGFLKHEREYYVYIKVPAFAVKSQHDGKYYLFDKTRLGIPLGKSHDVLQYHDHVVMIDNNNHPFIHLIQENFAYFCTGGNKLPTKGKDVGDLITKRLRKAKDILMYGYGEYQDCYQLREICNCKKSHYGNHIRSREELEKMGVQIVEGGNAKYQDWPPNNNEEDPIVDHRQEMKEIIDHRREAKYPDYNMHMREMEDDHIIDFYDDEEFKF